MTIPLGLVALLLSTQEPTPPVGTVICWTPSPEVLRCKNSSGRTWDTPLAPEVPIAKPVRVRQALPSDLEFTIRGCLNRGVETPEWCGPPAQAQSAGEIRQLCEHLRREVRTRQDLSHDDR